MFSAIIKTFPCIIQTKPIAVSTLLATSNALAPKASPVIGSVRFQQQASSAGINQQAETEHKNMDKKEDPPKEVEKKGDVMSHPFGEGYATRSDEEGFGGTYRSNQSLSKNDDDDDDEDKIVHGNSPEYDKTQGSEVKEKEKARNQTQANS